MKLSRYLSDVGVVVLIVTVLVVSLCGTISTVTERDELLGTDVTASVRSDQVGDLLPFDVIQEISTQITVPAGREYYVVYDSASQTLTEIPIASPTARFPQSALDAIDRSPNWIKDNLTRKFEQMADEPIQVQGFAAPDFADLDADGDLDLVVGTESDGLKYFENVEEGLHYYEGYDIYVGGVLVSNDSMFGALALTRADPAVTDLDGDNDLDILIGVSNGVWFLTNLGTPQAPSWSSIQSTSIPLQYSSIDVGDVDADGDPDLVIGNQAGELYLSINQAADPQHISDGDPATTTTSVFSSPNYLNLDVEDYASPALGDVDFDGDLDMVAGNLSGGLSFHENIWTPDNPFWTPNNATVFGEIDFGANSMPTFADVDLDMLQEIAIGNDGGYVHYIPNAGTATDPMFLIWDNVPTSFNVFNRNYYYIDDADVLLKERTIPARMIDYVNLINSVPDHMVDELAFSVANTATSSLMHSATYPDAYRNNTEALYYNDMFIDYADILDLVDAATGDHYSTLRYWVNESGTRVAYIVPRDIYYWYLAHPRVSYELPTFINPNVVTNMHMDGGAAAPPAGKFWRWYLFNENDTVWPADPGAVKYPKDEGPPLMVEKLAGVNTTWNVTFHITPAGYGNDGHNNSRPWNYSDHAVERVSHWVSLTLALNAMEGGDTNRPRQPVRIAHEHNGNCGELHDLTTAAFRAALIPAIGVMSAAEDHCWNEFWHNGWHHHDNYWSNSASIIGNNDFKHYTPGWNRDWTAIYGVEGDTRVLNHIDKYHHEEDHNGDGFQDRGNVSVRVVDSEGNPVDGAKVSIAGWGWGPPYESWGDFSTYTGPDGVAFFTTSESRQNDTFDDGIQIDVSSKFGGGSLNPGYANRYKICIDPPNLPLYSYQYQVGGTVPRPWLKANPTAPPEESGYWLDVDFDVQFGIQHPLADASSHADDQFDGDRVAHPEYFWDNITLDTFIADEQNFQKYIRGDSFDSTNLSVNVSSGSVFLGLPMSGKWYFVLSNRDSLETKKIVDLTIRLIEDLRPGVPHIVRGAFTGVAQEDITLTWERSSDDGLGEDDILTYTVHRALDYHGPYSAVDTIAADGRLYYNWTDPGLGIGDPTDYFYYVVCHDNLSAMRSPETAGKVVQYMYGGANLLSVPVYAEDTSVPAVMATVSFDEVRMYDASDAGDPWKSYHKAKYINDLQGIRPLDGIWVNALSEGNLTIIGLILPYHSIDLQQGWNLMGYPSFNASYTVGDLKAELGAIRVEGFDPSSPPYFLQVLPDAYVLKAGESYWIELPTPMTWNIDT